MRAENSRQISETATLERVAASMLMAHLHATFRALIRAGIELNCFAGERQSCPGQEPGCQ